MRRRSGGGGRLWASAALRASRYARALSNTSLSKVSGLRGSAAQARRGAQGSPSKGFGGAVGETAGGAVACDAGVGLRRDCSKLHKFPLVSLGGVKLSSTEGTGEGVTEKTTATDRKV